MTAKGPFYNVPYRRRREGKTNYKLRKRLILSGLPRLVVRKTRSHIIAQMIKASVNGDEVTTSAHSSELSKKYGWLGNLDNLPASYLTGLLCGYRSVAKGEKVAVLDAGLQTPSRGSRLFAALKGVLDAGVEVSHNEKVLPDETRIAGQHIASYAKEISADPEVFSRTFSTYLARGLPPKEMPEHFASTREKIVTDFKESLGQQ